MAEKQILAALQMESSEARLLVGEVYNTRLNTLINVVVPFKGMEGVRIIDKKAAGEAVRKAVDQASAHLGTPINAVLLAIPAYRLKKETRTFSKVIDNPERKVTVNDVKDIFQKALTVNVGSDVVVINVACNSYKVNGITYRKVPVGEQCDVLEADIDLLCCDKLTAYDYATVVEQSDIKIIDVCLDNYAAAKEAALFEQTMQNYVLAIQLEKQHTMITVIYDGKVVTAENENVGYQLMSLAIKDKFQLPEKNSTKLLMKYAQLDRREFDGRPIYSWTMNGVNKVISDRDLYDTVIKSAEYIGEDLANLCGPILSMENVTVALCGDGAEIDGIDKLIAEKFNKPVKCYFPETLGARSGRWTVCLGMFYAYTDQKEIHQNATVSVDTTAYLAHLNNNIYNSEHGEGFTARLKSLLFNNQKNGEE